MIAIAFTGIRVFAEMVRVIRHLKDAMMRHDPVHLFTDIGFDNRRGQFGVIHGGEIVTNIVYQRRYDPLFVSAVLLRAGRCLQRML